MEGAGRSWDTIKISFRFFSRELVAWRNVEESLLDGQRWHVLHRDVLRKEVLAAIARTCWCHWFFFDLVVSC